MKVKNWEDSLWGYALIAPTILGLVILNIWPIFKTLWLSFCEDKGFGRYAFIGSENYSRLWQDERVMESISNTLTFSLFSIPIGIFIALILASLMSSKIKRMQIYRIIYFLPMIAAPAAVAMVWKMIFNSDYGILNSILNVIGLQGVSWVSDPRYAMKSIITIAIWGGLGQQIIILIAAITGVSQSYYEAADIDGAGGVRKLFHITLPLVSPSIFFLAITGIIGALRQFDLIYMMYNNTTNPAIGSVRTLMYEYYMQAFGANDKGYASAIVIFTFLIIMAFTGIQFLAQKKWVHYE